MNYDNLRKLIYNTYNDTNSFEDFISAIFPSWRSDIDSNGIDYMRDCYNGSKHAEKKVMEILTNAFNSVTDYSNDKTRWDIKQYNDFENLVNDVMSCYEIINDCKINRDIEPRHYR